VSSLADNNGYDADEEINRLKLDPSKKQLSEEERSTLKANINLLRDILVLFTATGSARGVSGHTGKFAIS
jgi:hypothetical protein